MIVLLAALALAPGERVFAPPPPPVLAPGASPPGIDFNTMSDEGYCALMGGAAKRATAKMPMQIMPNVEATSISLDCRKRASLYSYRVKANVSQVRKDWRAMQKAAFEEKVCKGEITGPMARRGWRFTQVYKFDRGGQIVIVAKCRK